MCDISRSFCSSTVQLSSEIYGEIYPKSIENPSKNLRKLRQKIVENSLKNDPMLRLN